MADAKGNTFMGEYGFNIGIPNKSTFAVDAQNEKGVSPTPKKIEARDLRAAK